LFFEVEGITKTYGGLTANNNINLKIEQGSIAGLIGPNGAGKSTLFKIISGFIVPDRGSVRFKGKSLTRLSPHVICNCGIACTFQDVKNFPQLDVFETIQVGAYCRHTFKRQAASRAREVMIFLDLIDQKDQKIVKLNMLDRKKVALAAALATDPDLLLLDELFAGCTPTEVSSLLLTLKKINQELGITLFIIEHVLKVIMSTCQLVFVLDDGTVIESGTPEQICMSKKVISAYLGEDYDASQHQ
jgi:branched-chain amino acid transport system ATP-binding protein